MQYYKLELKPIIWPHLTNEQLVAKMRALLDIGAHVLDSSFSDFVPETKPDPEVRIERVEIEIFVCPFPKCAWKFHSKSSMLRHYQRKHEGREIPIKVTR